MASKSRARLAANGGLGRHVLPPRIAVALAAAKLLGADEARAEQFAAPPRPHADPHHRAAGGEGQAEHFWDRERADVEADAALGYIDDEAFDPRRIRCRNHKARPPNLDSMVLTVAEVFAMSRHPGPPFRYRNAKPLSGGYGEKLTRGLREPGNLPCPGRGAAFFVPLRRAGTASNTAPCNGPGSAAHRFAKATRCAASGARLHPAFSITFSPPI